jgi:phosphoribosylformimino-5-aminoimidazole carboxamide ribonucleotide (ProFAR) isomerase
MSNSCETLEKIVVEVLHVVRDHEKQSGKRIPVIAAGGIATLEDVQKMARLEKFGVAGLITGKAIYSGSLRLPEAIRWLKHNTKADRLFE